MLTITWQPTPGDESSRITLNVPREIDADSPEAAEFFHESYLARRAAGDTHTVARVAARALTLTEFPKADLTRLEARRGDGTIDQAVRDAAIAASRLRARALRIAKGRPAGD